MRKNAGFWDTIKDIGRGVADTYDKARMGWEIGKMEPKPRWQQRMDATMNNEPIYINVPDPENPGRTKRVLRYMVEDPNRPGEPLLDENGQPVPPEKNPYYVPGFKEKINQIRAYTGQGGSLFGLRNSLRSRGKRMTQKAEKAIVQDETLAQRIEQAFRLFLQGNPSAIRQLEQEGLIENDISNTQPATPPARPGTIPVQPGQQVAAQPTAQPTPGIPANQQMATNTGTITGPVY